MRKLLLLAGVAALAGSAPASAAQGEGGRGRGYGPSAHAGHGGASASRAGRADRSERGQRRAAAPKAGRPNRGEGGRRGSNRQERQAERAIGQERRANAAARSESRSRRDQRVDRSERRVRQAQRRQQDGSIDRRLTAQGRFGEDFSRFRRDRARRLAVGREGCPPGLARQNAYCMPPGQLRRAHLIGQPLPTAYPLYEVPNRYRYRFVDDARWHYRYSDGSVYRLHRESGFVDLIVPIFSSGLLPGEPMPLGYDVYNVPLAYRSYYPDSDDYLYRYDDSAIYRVDPDNGLVAGIVALLTGGVGGLGALGVGDVLPGGYDAYNVPLDYRDDYPDSDEAMYRYADGSIYEVDPQSRMIESVISLLV